MAFSVFFRQKSNQAIIADRRSSSALPKSPVSSSHNEVVLHIKFDRPPTARKFVIGETKRLLQHYPKQSRHNLEAPGRDRPSLSALVHCLGHVKVMLKRGKRFAGPILQHWIVARI